MSDAATLPEFAGFFENAREGRLAFPRCRSCGLFHWYPMPRCPHCRSSAIDWIAVKPVGELFSFTRVKHAFDDSGRALPYVVALVTFLDAPGVRFITNMVQSDVEALTIGQPVEAVFASDGSGEPLVLFRPAA